ncbi:NETI motif-containing protein [Sporosarcina aquimarina]|uniref:NETI motif-containing protein n=1 Tax=Sporosarcina TaxID=1569 RepID=UPI00046E63CE|nr:MULTISPECIES: NETI motif-containing protein [Sporosarcina]MCM3758461.1 NETI motif-containing protein [Sporosarcina aquimarina]
MSQRKTVWFQVEEHETISDCIDRMKAAGYVPAGRKEEPLFEERDGKYVPIRQMIQLKGVLADSE